MSFCVRRVQLGDLQDDVNPAGVHLCLLPPVCWHMPVDDSQCRAATSPRGRAAPLWTAVLDACVKRPDSLSLHRDASGAVERAPCVGIPRANWQAAHDYGAVPLLLLRCVMLCLVCGCLKQCKAALRLTILPACLPHTHQLRLVPLAVLAARSAALALAIRDCAPALGGRTSLCPGAGSFSG